ncbi:MAG: TetR/AcrR family transcriptional regulator [Myxococcota bacterium]|jgi:AcrR family transcriptional regulator|nr:TetR/AcrR family transcriptional regulator [Myxococcota bacterium]
MAAPAPPSDDPGGPPHGNGAGGLGALLPGTDLVGTTESDAAPTAKGSRTRRAVLDAARELFVAQGFHGTAMRQVAATSGLALGALYNHFASKDALFEAVFAEHNPFRLVPEAFEQAQGDSVQAMLEDVAQRLNHELRERPDLLRLVLIELLEFNGRHIPAILTRNAEVVALFYERLQKAPGSVRPVQPLLLMRVFLGLLSAWFLTDTLFGGEMPASLSRLQIVDAVDIFLHGALEPVDEGSGPTAPPAGAPRAVAQPDE